jgi:hypothetical protein
VTQATIHDILCLLSRLKEAHIYYRLGNPTEGALMVEVAVPGERWEIEFHEDGEIGVEVFASSGVIEDSKRLEDLFRRFTD